MRGNYYLTAALAFGLLISPVSALAGQNQAAYEPKPVYDDKGAVIGSSRGVAAIVPIDWQLADGYQVLDIKQGDATGDGIPDNVYLIGHKQSETSRYADSRKLIVEDGANKTRTDVPLGNMGGYDAEIPGRLYQ